MIGWRMTSRTAYEAAEYEILEVDGSIELREYPDLKLVTTDMQFDSQGNDGSFMRLFRYISGANDDKQKVAMTIPVFMERDSGETPGQMGFVLPKQVAAEKIPGPTNGGVEVATRDGGTFAAIRFAGRINSKLVDEKRSMLEKWLKSRGLRGDGEYEIAGYDAPCTPGPFRRNEVLIRVLDAERN